jgi:6-phosphofructokinase 2
MTMIATLTMNPAIDAAYAVETVVHTHKMRSSGERYDPGGGGINVARVIARLGGAVRAYYLSGGATGPALDGLLDRHMLARTRIPIAGDTRLSSVVFERSTGKEYRFVPKGPTLAEKEWQAAIERLEEGAFEILVAAGSLPNGAPEDFYARVGTLAKRKGARFVLDSSGPALKAGVDAGNIWLLKASRGEFRRLTGESLETAAELGEAAQGQVRQGKAEMIAVTLGHEGALLATPSEVIQLPAIPLEVRSSVGAGDSFLGAMVFALFKGEARGEAFRFGLAAGAAALLNPGTGLCHPEDIKRLLPNVPTLPPATERTAA